MHTLYTDFMNYIIQNLNSTKEKIDDGDNVQKLVSKFEPEILKYFEENCDKGFYKI